MRDARDLLFCSHVGPYRLGVLLGEGGMDTDAIVRRFASERKALALMDPAVLLCRGSDIVSAPPR